MFERVVYAIQHNRTKRIYIGSSERAEHRIKNEHLAALKRGNHPNELMQKDFDEYGNDYSFYYLDVIPNQYFKDREYYWMLYFETYKEEKGYNYKDYAVKNRDINQFPKVEIEPTKSVTRKKEKEEIADSIIYKNVVALCKEFDISICSLEKKAGLANGTIGKWRKSRPNLVSVNKLAKYLKVPVERLIEENGN